MKQSRHGEEYTIVDGKHVHGVALRVDTAEQREFQNVIDHLIDQYRSSAKHMHQHDRHLLRAYVGKCDVQPKGWQNVFSRRDARADAHLQEEGLDASLIESLRTPAKVAMWYGCSEKKARKILRNAVDCFPHIRAQVTTPMGQFFKGEEDFGPAGFLPDPQSAPKLRKEASTNGEESNQHSGEPFNRPFVDDNQYANSVDSEHNNRVVDVDISGGGAAGFVYILTNAALSPDYLKIGMTTRTSEQRAREISSGTGVVCAYQVAYEEPVRDCRAVERTLHKKLSKFRLQSNREFFCLPLKEAIRIIQEIATSCKEEVEEQSLPAKPTLANK